MKRVVYVLFGCLWLVMGMGVVSAQDSRVVSDQDLGMVRNTPSESTVPSQKTHADIRTSNTVTDVNDPLHACAGNDVNNTIADSAGSYSVFTQVVFPGGVLSIRTTGSNYNTILSVYSFVDASQPLAAAVACNDDSILGSNYQSSVDVTLPAGRYLIMVSRFGETPAASALSLSLYIGVTFSGTSPTNDYPFTPVALTAHQAFSQTDVHFATDDDLDVALNANCEVFNSVWYTYTAPVDGEYQFTSYGSLLKTRYGDAFTTAIGVYEVANSGTLASDYTLEGCFIANEYNAVTTPLELLAGDTYHIRLGTYANDNLLPGSKYKIKPVVTTASLLTNDRFNDGLTGWKTTNFGVGDGTTSNVITINAGETKKTLSQTKTSFPSTVKWVKGGILHFDAGYAYTGVPSGKFTVRVVYSDGKPSTVVNIPFSTSDASYVSTYIPLASTKVKSVRAMATTNAGSGWSVSINFMVLRYVRDAAAIRAMPAQALPFPTVK